MSERFYKVYSAKEYWHVLRELHEDGYQWCSGRSLLSRSQGFSHPCALVVSGNRVYIDEIRHCPDPTDRRLEETNLKKGDKVVLNDRYMESESHKGEVFEIVELMMIGQTPCAFLSPSGLGAYACDGLTRRDDGHTYQEHENAEELQ